MFEANLGNSLLCKNENVGERKTTAINNKGKPLTTEVQIHAKIKASQKTENN